LSAASGRRGHLFNALAAQQKRTAKLWIAVRRPPLHLTKNEDLRRMIEHLGKELNLGRSPIAKNIVLDVGFRWLRILAA
jgi:hypothetical protein